MASASAVRKQAFGIDLLVQGVAEAARAAALSGLNGDASKPHALVCKMWHSRPLQP
jgi:hypothetical protein